MTSHVLDYDLDSVLPFVQTRMGGLDRSERMTAIGLRRDGRDRRQAQRGHRAPARLSVASMAA
jgi:hypothetical protein